MLVALGASGSPRAEGCTSSGGSIFSVVSFAFHALERRDRLPPPVVSAMARRFAEALPGPEAPRTELQASLDGLAEEYGVDATLWDPSGKPLAWAGQRLRGPHWRRFEADRVRFGPRGISVPMPDGRQLGIRPLLGPRRGRDPLLGLLFLNAAIAVVAYPVSRRMARRLERLRGAVDELGSGDLSARVPVEGRDEIADLARSFNRAAERIEGLVTAERRVLAGASHELRSPLTRLRMALELLARDDRPELLAAAERDIEELDALIGDVLRVARLEARAGESPGEPVALLELASEEAARAEVEAAVSGEPITLRGDPGLLRRLLRNLLENARRYGGGDVEVSVEALEGGLEGGRGARIRVADRGPGVPEAERSRIFEPFYRPAGHSEGRHGGVGLGLALVAEIARHHGGEARCLPRPGGGSVFEVDLYGNPPPEA